MIGRIAIVVLVSVPVMFAVVLALLALGVEPWDRGFVCGTLTGLALPWLDRWVRAP